MTNIRKELGTWDLLIWERTCKLSVWLMKVCRKSTRFRKRFRQNPLGLVQDLRESTRLGKSFARIHSAFDKRFARIHSDFDKRFARIHSAFDKRFARIHSAFDKRFARIHSAFDKHLRESTRLLIKGLTRVRQNPLGFIMSDVSGPDTLGMTFLMIRR